MLFREVEDYFVSVNILTKQLDQEASSVASSKEYLDIALARYNAGVDTYLNVLTAQDTLLNNQLSQISIRNSQLTSSAQLIAALGGGWNASQLPTEKQVQKKS